MNRATVEAMETDTEAGDWAYSVQEYVRLEEESNIKHEFVDGQIRAMAGGTQEHARLATALTVLIGNQLDGKPCDIVASKIHPGQRGMLAFVEEKRSWSEGEHLSFDSRDVQNVGFALAFFANRLRDGFSRYCSQRGQ